MACTEGWKVLFGTHMLSEEVEDWWDNARQRLEVTEYAAKFEELVKFCPHYYSDADEETTSADMLIRGTCFINDIPLIAIIDTDATHSFISLNCAKRLDLQLSSIIGSIVIDTPFNGSVTISLVCLKCPLTIYGKSFVIDLVCLHLSLLDVILGMDLLEFNRVNVNWFSKTLMFPVMGGDRELMFVAAQKVEEFLKEEAQMFSLFASLGIDSKVMMQELLVVCDFPKVFPERE
ncbi:uncharacterized protein LOC127079782 [Lathyrus oleraceus]|uniref:uncharacterized protein LOC127079782 n=1 Tax=Pisum sativum TaxID=3888 RepID=UPI0021D30938|nr:uncharacterized protein LOC127079782 [Pisum sativum]